MNDSSVTGRRVGVIGLGAMGAGMAGSLRRAGCDVHVCDVRDGVAATSRRAAARRARRRPSWPRRCEVVVSVVVNAAQTESVLFGADGAAAAMRPGAVFVMCSTVDPNVSIAFERRLEAIGLGYVDAPISGGAAKAASGEMTVMGAAKADAWQKAEPFLNAMAAKVYRLGDDRGQRQQGQDHQPAARRRAHRRRRRGDGARPARRRRRGGAVRGHHAQRRQQLDVREPDGARPRRRLHAALGGRHLRQGPRPGARHGARDQVSAAAREHGAPDVHAGVERRLRQGRRLGGDQDLPRHRAAGPQE